METDKGNEIVDILSDISNLLEAGLDKESLVLLIRLCSLGVSPETLSEVIQEIRKDIVLYSNENVVNN
ncbi:uncharacterized protein CMU_017830 [Cryptosporidium muris RN66]|uniref:Mitotic-spindle organizing protein 1 n=1 Tax=Cryptosporidium muris (strain RN66) TaxID=441375 RepID=B6AD25_CRYMR|nr:uncharacterized protein CMU_017830 [Cryptosporidium muris RN66]EEA06029.1 hypothetical protein, conserved [Cryptosporidium muris RN66]|eukprot:XP_002140378.1 hypothetical protein [Cryptosporidium muris RN66]